MSVITFIGAFAGCTSTLDQEAESTAVSLHELASPDSAKTPGKKTKVSPELELDASPILGPAPGAYSAVALGGAQHLVVWTDQRAGRTLLFGARVKLDGTVRDPYGIRIFDDPSMPSYQVTAAFPSVASDGDDFLVVAKVNGEIRGVRVDHHGVVLDPGGFPISSAAGNDSPTVAFDGVSYLVAWTHYDAPNNRLYRARVAPDGTVLDPGGALLGVPDGRAPDLAFDGTNYFMTWMAWTPEGGCQTSGARISPLGTTLDPSGIPIGLPLDACYWWSRRPRVSFDGTNLVVLWLPDLVSLPDDPWFGLYEQLRATRVTPEGAVLDPEGIVIATLEGFAYFSGFDGASDGTGTTIAWSGAGENYWYPVQRAQLDPDGSVTHPLSNGLDNGENVAVASSGDGALVTWMVGEALYSQFAPIVGMRLDANGDAVDAQSMLISTNANAQEVEAAASSGQGSLVVWRDTRFGLYGPQLVGALVGPSGEVLDPAGILIPESWEPVGVSIVFDGTNFRVIWQNGAGEGSSAPPVRSVRVSPQGAVLDALPVQLPVCTLSNPSAASDGTHTLFVGDDCTESYQKAAALVDAQGTTVSIVGLGAPDYLSRDVRVTFDGTSYLVTWSNGSTVVGQRVSPQGALLDAQPFVIVSAAQVYFSTAGVGGGNHLVVWNTASGLFGARVDSSGQVLDPQGFLVATPYLINDSCAPYGSGEACSSVAFDGLNFVIAWRAEATPGGPNARDLFATKVSPSGSVLASFAISEKKESEGPAILTSNGDGKVLAAYTRFMPKTPYSARRAQMRVLSSHHPGSP